MPACALAARKLACGCVWMDGKLRFTPVKAGVAGLDGKVQIVEGLKAGDEIVVYSERELQDDSRIKVVSSLGGK